jgi:hypothetical protein
MTSTAVRKFRVYAAIIGCCAAIALFALAAHLNQAAQLHASGISDGQAVSISTPPATPAITKAAPSITGPAPLYAGEAPDTNPQAQIP